MCIRDSAGTASTPGREFYSRRAKALVQVGGAGGRGDPRATRPVGLSLEIVPERDPYALGKDRLLPVHILYEGRRLPGALVKLRDLHDDEKPVATALTDRNGRAAFRIPATGPVSYTHLDVYKRQLQDRGQRTGQAPGARRMPAEERESGVSWGGNLD